MDDSDLEEQASIGSSAQEIKNGEEDDDDFGDDALFAEDLWAQPVEAATNPGEVAGEVNVTSFDELVVEEAVVLQVQEAWRMFLETMPSRSAAGDAIYLALFEATSTMKHLFTTPRAVAAMRFLENINSIILSLADPPQLKVFVETLAFGHMNMDTTVPRVIMFRDALLDMIQIELGDKLPTKAFFGFKILFTYVGGAIIYVRVAYGGHLRILGESWKQANCGKNPGSIDHSSPFTSRDDSEQLSPGEKSSKSNPVTSSNAARQTNTPRHGEGVSQSPMAPKDASASNDLDEGQDVPTTFPEMFLFNAAVMGFGSDIWMNEVLACFDNIVKNVSNSNRLQEECDVLTLRIARVKRGKIHLPDYKSCMLATLRALLPKVWSTEHEVAWSWLWDAVQRMLLKNMGRPPQWEKAYFNFLSKLNEGSAFDYRAQIYANFFAMAPRGQDYFKQSNTYLHIIAIKVMEMSLDIYRDPAKVTHDITAVGLRHVGYGIPTEFFGPFVSANIEVLKQTCTDEVAIDGARWSMGLLAKSMVRTIMEGSTIVMKAINVNSKRAIAKAIACAPRGERAQWMLRVAVGTQAISPLAWSIEGGKLEAASAIIKDLLTFRADRENYYYGAEELFSRHPDIVKKLCDDAPGLLPELLDGLIWRSKISINGQRRVNYYLKHLIIDPDGHFAHALDWISRLKDPTIVTHPLLVLVADITWSKIAARAFLFKKSWFLLTFFVFLLAQSVIGKPQVFDTHVEQAMIFGCRCFVYVCSLGRLIASYVSKTFTSYRTQDTITISGVVPVPKFLSQTQEIINILLAFILFAMLLWEPILHCAFQGADDSFTQECPQARDFREFPYSTLAMLAMYIYYALLFDLAVFSTRFSAYVLACGRMLSEVALFLLAVLATITMFACGFSCLHQNVEDFHGFHRGAISLLVLVFELNPEGKEDELKEEHWVLVGTYVCMMFVTVFLVNMLIAQLSCSYGSTYRHMVGFARLKRIHLIVETMHAVSERRWHTFVGKLKLGVPLEFNEGDVGLAGGIQMLEPASANPTTIDMIQRFGGATALQAQWPANEREEEDESDKFMRLERFVAASVGRLSGGPGLTKTRAALGEGSVKGSSGGGSSVAASAVWSAGSGGSEVE